MFSSFFSDAEKSFDASVAKLAYFVVEAIAFVLARPLQIRSEP
jgi:hypothetical protein